MFDTEKEKKGLELSTFDIVQVAAFHNTRFWTILSFLWVWIVLLLKLLILAGDTYTCISILVFKKWGTTDYQVYEYKVARWIFTGCILFRFVLLAYQIAWGVHVYRTRNIALAYLNSYASMMYAMRSYDYQCLFHEIDLEGFFEWACFLVYWELDNALEVLAADMPRQVINFMTLRYYATGGDSNNDILANIKLIATTNLRLSVILSFQLCTMVLFLFFFFKFALGMLFFIPVKVKVSHKGARLVKAYCYKVVNENVRYLVARNHKLKTQIVAEGIMDVQEVNANPLLASLSTLDFGDVPKPDYPYGYRSTNISLTDLSVQPAADYSRLGARNYSASSLRENPFADAPVGDKNRFMRNVSENPFADPVAPPPRTHTADTLARLQAAPVGTSDSLAHGLYGAAAADSMTRLVDNSSHTRLPERRPPPVETLAPDRSDGSDLSRLSSVGLIERESSGSKVGSEFEYAEQVVESDDASREDVTAPYPVRGVSQYFGDTRDDNDL